LVRTNSTYSIDHEIKARYYAAVGHRHASDDLEAYMKSRAEEYEKIKNMVAPDQGTTTTNLNSDISNFNSKTNNKSVTLQQEKEKIGLDVLNMSKPELNINIDKLENKTVLCRVKANAHMVETIANTRIQSMR
jgi:hypothetical protein